jgi:hypothetical protein
MKKFLESPLGKLLLEAGRWAVLGAVSIFITKVLELVPSLELAGDFEVRLVAFLRFADLLVHKSGIVKKGILPF